MYVNYYREQLLEATKLNLDIKSAKGSYLFLKDGRKVKDYLAQYGALPFGHNPSFAIEEINNFIRNESPILAQPNIHHTVKKLAEKLAEQIDNKKYTYCVFTNSGAETVEVAIKLSRLYTGRKKVLSLVDSFHGKTYSALSATGSKRFKADNIADENMFEHVDINDIEQIEDKIKSKTFASFIIEPVQGEGGMNVIPPNLLTDIIKLCKENGTVSIFDEIQTGVGRLGSFCAATLYNLKPDIILFSKALGAGFMPIGAMLYAKHLHLMEFDKKHSSTFANNVLAASMGLAVINHLTSEDKKRQVHVQQISSYVDMYLNDLLKKYSTIFTWKGLGLMRSLELQDPQASSNIVLNFSQKSGGLAYIICSFLLKHYGVFTMPLMSRPCSIRFEPALDITKEDIDYFFNAFDRVCQIIQNGRYDILFAHLIDLHLSDLPPLSESYPVSINNNIAPTKITNKSLPEGKKFAFLIHTTSIKELNYNYCEAIKQNYTQQQQDQLSEWITETAIIDFSPEVAVEFAVENNICYSNGMLIFSPIRAEKMLLLSKKERTRLMNEFLDVAKSNHAEVVGLGAYTSVISDGGKNLVDNSQQLLLTNGNSLTGMSVVESIRSMLNNEVASQILAVIGARGSVGKISVIGLAHNFSRIILVGRPKTGHLLLSELIKSLLEVVNTTRDIIVEGSLLSNIKQWLLLDNRTLLDFPSQLEQLTKVAGTLGLKVTECYEEALSQADFIVSATSEGKAFLNTSTVKKSAVIFDAARPFDFVRDQEHFIYEGGLISQPNKTSYGDSNIIDVPAGVNLACLSETIAMALDNSEQHLSIGKNIAYNDALSVLNMSKKHTFTPILYNTFNEEN
ncbi:aminotransferase class III-fold pyridoxal phosphate-dependent enzyme [Entomomonas sp. E2T0]|uniref:aminotransferase class III-fold pyridoxal phosphate-dependent enzyme n=1 Tax=Entomomonas sp. E2T0 TaxID=2930213 RepID=UPI0022281C82|nr:aminotransferase class III-fold pyridoxal phosphate-dependent enzyme [Entomomonas sp. E2T0]UYZ84931.1 aminotransferase class III-fold pyridoxal phosphate-dependent enzyme [Entomomonas sp. E2T0]